MLEPERVVELIKAAQQGDDGAKETLIASNMPLIKSVVRRYRGKSVEYDDLIQLGSLGLLKAVINFDLSYNVRFSTYAVPMIAGEIKRYMRDDGAIKVSRALKVMSYKINKYIEEYRQEKNTDPSVEEIAAALNIDKEEVVFAIDSTRFPLSIYDNSDEDGGVNLIDKIAAENKDDDNIDKILLFEALKTLNERDRKIILLRYFRDKTQSEVAAEMGVSQVQISRLESKILTILKEKIGN